MLCYHSNPTTLVRSGLTYSSSCPTQKQQGLRSNGNAYYLVNTKIGKYKRMHLKLVRTIIYPSLNQFFDVWLNGRQPQPKIAVFIHVRTASIFWEGSIYYTERRLTVPRCGICQEKNLDGIPQTWKPRATVQPKFMVAMYVEKMAQLGIFLKINKFVL